MCDARIAARCCWLVWMAAVGACGPAGSGSADTRGEDARPSDAATPALDASAEADGSPPPDGSAQDAAAMGDAMTSPRRWGEGCVPACLSDTIGDCAPQGACVQQADPEYPSVVWQCYANGVRARVEYSVVTGAVVAEVRRAGRACFGLAVDGADGPLVVRDASGQPVATIPLRGDGGTRREVACGGTTYTIDSTAPNCAGMDLGLHLGPCTPGECLPDDRDE